jgi:hypothetical protein
VATAFKLRHKRTILKCRPRIHRLKQSHRPRDTGQTDRLLDADQTAPQEAFKGKSAALENTLTHPCTIKTQNASEHVFVRLLYHASVSTEYKKGRFRAEDVTLEAFSHKRAR